MPFATFHSVLTSSMCRNPILLLALRHLPPQSKTLRQYWILPTNCTLSTKTRKLEHRGGPANWKWGQKMTEAQLSAKESSWVHIGIHKRRSQQRRPVKSNKCASATTKRGGWGNTRNHATITGYYNTTTHAALLKDTFNTTEIAIKRWK